MFKTARTFVYDGSFEGFLCCVFQAYDLRAQVEDITTAEKAQAQIGAELTTVFTHDGQADRVWTGFTSKVSSTCSQNVYKCFLSEQPGIELVLFRFMQAVFSGQAAEHNYAFEPALIIHQLGKRVQREVHRMHAFVRFEQAEDGLFAATIAPDFNVLPLIGDHFEKRYADQRWLIYDSRRKAGLYYDLHQVQQVTLETGAAAVADSTGTESANGIAAAHANEGLYKHLWQQYFSTVNISERRNMKLHIQHVPRRYWKYLSEKQSRVYAQTA